MAQRLLRLLGRVSLLPRHEPPSWSLSQIAGRLVEISGKGAMAALTSACGLVLDAQRRRELVAWITLSDSSFFPPDFEESGVDLQSLVVVRVHRAAAASRSAVQLLRSGAFGLIVIDLGPRPSPGTERISRANGDGPTLPYGKLPPAHLSQMVGLAQKHSTAVVVLTEKPSGVTSLSSLVSLRAEAERGERQADSRDFDVSTSVLKDKRRGPGQVHRERHRGPAGLR